MLGRAPSRRFAQRAADPSRLWVQAHLFGLAPEPPESSRVLELGCGDGAHLAGIAARHPAMQVVGLDTRAEAIAEGKQLVERAGISNLRLEVGALEALPALGGRFDYVICEGAFSRAAPDERELLLAGVARALSERGLACIEYDARPAFRLHELVADIVRRSLGSVEPSAPAVRERLALLLEAEAGDRGIGLLKPELEAWSRRDDAWLSAELVWPRRGVSFHDFAGALERHGLGYVCESTYAGGSWSRLQGKARALVDGRAPLRREQYVDFLFGRRQRRSLLSRAETPAAGSALAERCASLYCVSPLQAGAGGSFVVPGGFKLQIAEPLLAAIVGVANEAWPEALSFTELAARVRERFPSSTTAELERAALRAHEHDWLELRRTTTGCAREPGEKPRVSPLNRAELSQARPLTNRLHTPIQLGGGAAAELVACLDGAHDRRGLSRRLSERGYPAAQVTPAAIEQVLAALVRRGLIEVGEARS